MRWHLAAATASVPFRKIFQTELTRRHAAPQYEAAIAIVRNDVIVRLHLNRHSGQRFVTHSGNMKMSLALTDQILLAQVRMAAFHHRAQKPQLIFLAWGRHTA